MTTQAAGSSPVHPAISDPESLADSDRTKCVPGAEPLRIISLGAGVQSTTLALMATRGEIGPMPSCAIFADTGDEPETPSTASGRGR